MQNFKIKQPRPNNIDLVVRTYNRKKGQGIEIFYNIKNGRLFIADHYKNYSDNKNRKISLVSGGAHLASISPEYLNEEVERVKHKETESRIAEKNTKKSSCSATGCKEESITCASSSLKDRKETKKIKHPKHSLFYKELRVLFFTD